MREARGCSWIFLVLGIVLPLAASARADSPNAKLNKIIIYPDAEDSIAQLKQRGIQKVDDCGSYWVAEATDAQVDTLRKSHGDRVVKAYHLNRIELQAKAIDTTAGEPEVPAGLQQTETAGKRLRLIQFKGPIRPEWLEQVRAVGDLRVINYVPNNAYLVWLDATTERKLQNLLVPRGPLQWIGAYHPYYKISKDLRTVSANEPIEVRVVVVDDAQEPLTENRIQALGTVANSSAHNGQVVFGMEVLPSVVSQIVQLPGVLWIERVYPKRLLDEVQSLIVASQTNGPGHGPSTTLGITNYLDFLINNVGGGLPSFQNQFTYPIVDVADTGFNATFEAYPNFAVQPSLNEFGIHFGVSRVAYLSPIVSYFAGATIDSGCERLNLNFFGSEDFYGPVGGGGHGTRVASVIAGYDTQTNSTELCIFSTIVTQAFPTIIACPGAGAVTQMLMFATAPCPITTQIVVTCTSAGNINTNFALETQLIVTQIVDNVRRDPSGFQLGLGISPFGRVGSSRIFRQTADTFGTPPRVRFLPNPQQLSTCMEGLFDVVFNSAYPNGGRIQNNSWSEIIDRINFNGGRYSVDSQTYDTGVRDALLTGSATNFPGVFPLNQEFIIVFAANSLLGDAGVEGDVGGIGDFRVLAPATAKSVITVGSSENVRLDGSGCFVIGDRDNSLEIWQDSAFGPTLDGRFKPEIVAPGTTIYAARSLLAGFIDPVDGISPTLNRAPCEDPSVGLGLDNVSNCTFTNLYCDPPQPFRACFPDPSATVVSIGQTPLYDCRSGSSYAAPAVSGGIQLLWWYFQNRLTNEVGTALFQPSPAMAKAYLCNSARYLPITNPQTGAPDTLPSIAQGMGELDLLRMFDSVSRVIRDQSAPRAIDTPLITTNPAVQQTYFTATGQTFEWTGEVASNSLPFRVSLAWTDVPGAPGNFIQLVNDLDLEVTIGGQTYRGNRFAGPNSVTGGLPDGINPMESVFLPAGGAVTSGAPYRVVVRATNIAGDGVPNVGTGLDQDFALVVYNSQNPSDVPNMITNDACQTAISITNFPYVFRNKLNTTTYHNVHPSPSVARGGADEFFKIVSPTAGATVSVDTFGSSFDTVLSVWQVQVAPQAVFVRGECGALVELVSNANAGVGQQSRVTFTADGSNTYYIVVEPRNGGSGGTMVLNVQSSPLVTLTPNNLVFGTQFVGTASSVQPITFQNNAPVPVQISDVTVGGANPSDFVVSGGCRGSTVPSGSNCTITVAFSPTTNGLRTATLIVNDNSIGGPHTASLTGTGSTGGGVGKQPDAQISRKRARSSFIGGSIINTNGESQTIAVNARRRSRQVFYIRVQNAANAPDTFAVSGTGDILCPDIDTTNGVTVAYFLGADRRGDTDITAAVEAGTFRTGTLAPGAVTGDATLIRVEMKVDRYAWPCFYPATVMFTSVADTNKSDVVQAVSTVNEK